MQFRAFNAAEELKAFLTLGVFYGFGVFRCLGLCFFGFPVWWFGFLRCFGFSIRILRTKFWILGIGIGLNCLDTMGSGRSGVQRICKLNFFSKSSSYQAE